MSLSFARKHVQYYTFTALDYHKEIIYFFIIEDLYIQIFFIIEGYQRRVFGLVIIIASTKDHLEYDKYLYEAMLHQVTISILLNIFKKHVKLVLKQKK